MEIDSRIFIIALLGFIFILLGFYFMVRDLNNDIQSDSYLPYECYKKNYNSRCWDEE